MTSAASRFVLLCGLAAALLLISPAAATLALSDVTLTPPVILLAPLREQKVDAKIAIIPSGATTFAKGHTLQMQTELINATWSVQVLVNGIPAAQQSAEGSAAFVNGYLLSYSTNRDVAVAVSVDGTVPSSTGADVVLLTVQELDNQGAVVTGSTVAIRQPTAVLTGVPTTATVPVITLTQETTTAVPSPTKAGGFSLITGLIAVVAGSVVCGWYRRKKTSERA